jgi:hypothetical protein
MIPCPSVWRLVLHPWCSLPDVACSALFHSQRHARLTRTFRHPKVDELAADYFMPSIDVTGNVAVPVADASVADPVEHKMASAPFRMLRVTPPFLFANFPEDTHFFAFSSGTPLVARAEHLRAFARLQPPNAPFRPWAFGYDMYLRGRPGLSLTQRGSIYRPRCSPTEAAIASGGRLMKLDPSCLVTVSIVVSQPSAALYDAFAV